VPPAVLLPLPTGDDVTLIEGWLPPERADRALAALRAEVPWRQDTITLFGRPVLQPRLSAWMGEEDAIYTYSGLTLAPSPWTPEVRALRDLARDAIGEELNSVLLNMYRDGHDSMGLHSDDEPELGPAPCIASISLGATRTFVLKPKRKKSTTAPIRVELTHGSLLVMRGATQKNWVHGVPKQLRVAAPRINLTFRRIVAR
jgi:alkylated DNA repair dioxygenase AlkB